MTAIAQVAFPKQANGSFIVTADGRTIGSSLIGQAFSDPKYFSRPPVGGRRRRLRRLGIGRVESRADQPGI